ncbi:MAG: response regulator, partial [Zetaproteobacteria bacterium]
IVHDFRNILTSIIGQAEILQMETENERIRSELQAIIESGERGATIVSHLLALAKKVEQTKSQRLAPQHQAVLERLIGLVRFQLPPQIRLRHVIEEHLPAVELNVVEMEQILLNLVSNAAHAIEGDGEIDLYIRTEQGADGQSYLTIRVRDTGKGIPEDQLNQVTRPFWTSREKEGGTGLGLTMVQRIVKRHHGQLDIASSLGKGTTVTIKIPATVQADDNWPTFGAPALHAETHTMKPARILLVDDAEEVLRIHQALISRMGHAVTPATDGKKALDLLRSSKAPFNLVVTDYRMPELDGLGLLEEIRRSMPNLPVIMITAYGEDERLKKARELDAMLLNKPVNFHNLEQAIQQALTPIRSAQKP